MKWESFYYLKELNGKVYKTFVGYDIIFKDLKKVK